MIRKRYIIFKSTINTITFTVRWLFSETDHFYGIKFRFNGLVFRGLVLTGPPVLSTVTVFVCL